MQGTSGTLEKLKGTAKVVSRKTHLARPTWNEVTAHTNIYSMAGPVPFLFGAHKITNKRKKVFMGITVRSGREKHGTR